MRKIILTPKIIGEADFKRTPKIKAINKSWRYLVLIDLDEGALKDIKHFTFCLWAVSSVGRASRLHRGGQRFESFTAHQIKGYKWGCSSVG